MVLIASLGLIVWIAAWLFLAFGTYFSFQYFKSSTLEKLPLPTGALSFSPISILKPLKGVDRGLEENLRSFFLLDYPDFELLFSVADSDDPACGIVRSLMRRYPRVAARLMVSSREIGPNPKVNNILKSYEQAKNDWLLISDSNIYVESDYLKQFASHMNEETGVVTAVVAGTKAVDFAGHLEASFLNTFYARSMIVAAKMKIPCVLGKSMLFRRSAANRFGGLRTLGRFLAEDYMAGVAMQKLGLDVVLLRQPVKQNISNYSFRSFWLRHLRWGRIRKSQAAHIFLLELLCSSVFTGIFGSIAFRIFFHVPPSIFFSLHLLGWGFCDLFLIRKLNSDSSAKALFYWGLRELLAPVLWLHISVGNTVAWRGTQLKLAPGGTISAADSFNDEGFEAALGLLSRPT